MFITLLLVFVLQTVKSTVKLTYEKMLDYSKMNILFGFVCSLFRDGISFLLFIKFKIQLTKIEYFVDTLTRQFDRIVEKQPNKIAFNYHDEIFRFVDVYRLSNKVANWVESTLKLGRYLDEPSTNKSGDKKMAVILESVKNEGGDKVLSTTESDQSDNNGLQDHQIGLMMGNIPEMGAFMLGIARVRASSVLFNINHRGDALKNSFEATNCRAFVFESKYLTALRDIADDLPDIPYFMYNRSSGSIYESNPNLKPELDSTLNSYKGFSKFDLKPDCDKKFENFAPILARYSELLPVRDYPYKMNDNLMYIFTSGTTGGRVKATPQNNYRYIVGYLSQVNAFWLSSNDNFYICQPLHHTLAGVCGLSQCFLGGATVTLADKFSASKFLSDCRLYRCTVALYIGETARYLLAQPPKPDDHFHSLRMVLGVGMKKEIWLEFMERFNIPKVAEFYGSSEGNVNLFNTQNVVGSCGFIPYYFGPITRLLFPIFVIKVDPITLEPMRDSKGRCQFARAGDTGLLVGAIRPNIEYTKFLGYTSKQETSKKVIHKILNDNDCGFSSGDLVEMDLYGNLYFRDRTGDTFRWKGENVSTTEVEAVAAQFLNHQDCTAYGVQIPNTDGCAGMLAIKLDQPISPETEPDLGKLHSYMKTRLPEYALPKFVRFTDQIETTSTHKMIKYRLRQQGYNPNSPPAVDLPDSSIPRQPDKFFYWNKQEKKFIQIDQAIYDDIQNGNVQF